MLFFCLTLLQIKPLHDSEVITAEPDCPTECPNSASPNSGSSCSYIKLSPGNPSPPPGNPSCPPLDQPPQPPSCPPSNSSDNVEISVEV